MKRFLALYIFILVIVLFLGCLDAKNEFFGGTYQGQVVFYGQANDSVDTVFQTIVVVNQDFTCQNCYTLQWTFEDFMYLKNRLVRFPNIYAIGLDAKPSKGRLNFVLRDTTTVQNFNGYYSNDSLNIEFLLPKDSLVVKIRAYRPE